MLELRRSTDMTNVEIGRELGIPQGTVAQELHRLYALGFDVPVSPYKNGGPGSHNRVESPVWDASVRTLARALIERGHDVPCGEAAVA